LNFVATGLSLEWPGNITLPMKVFAVHQSAFGA
jgi:hypothetical protein